MPNKWYFLILLLLCRCLNGTGFSEWKCEEDKTAVLVYVKNQNQFIAHNISTGDTQILNPKFKTMGIVTDFVLDNAFGRSYYFGFLDDKRLNRVTDVQIEEEKIKKIKHSEIRDSVKEFEATRFHSYIYVITKENEIKLCCNPKMILVHSQPDTEYTNLILDDKRGRMFWIEEKSSNCAIKLAGMDGKNVREVYSNNKIYSFTHDNDLNQLHIALEDSIDVIDVNSKERKFQLNVKASRLYYYNCALYFDNRNSRKISVYSNEHKIKELVNDADVNSPFSVMYEVTRNYLANPCNNIFCADYCVFGESEQGPIPICIDPDADKNNDNSTVKRCNWNTKNWNWPAILFALLALAFLTVLLLEMKFFIISKWWFKMFNEWILLLFLLSCQLLNVSGFAEWSCANKNAILIYIKNQNQFNSYNVSTGNTQVLNPKFETLGHVKDLTTYYTYNYTHFIGFLDDKHWNRVTSLYAYTDSSNRTVHAEMYDSVKEFETTKFSYSMYIITNENEIKAHGNPKLILVRSQPNTQYRNLVLNHDRGQMFWIAEMSSDQKIMLAGMDGNNARQVYSTDKIYSFTYDKDLNQLYIALEDFIDTLNLKSMQQSFRDSRTISVYSTDHQVKQLVNDADVNSPFTVEYGVFRNLNLDPCNQITCVEYCVLSEGDVPVPRCVCPDCLDDEDENVEKWSWSDDGNEWNWPAIIFFIIALMFFVALVLEVKFFLVSKCCSLIKSKLEGKLGNISTPIDLFKR